MVGVYHPPLSKSPSRSIFGSIRKLGRSNSGSSQRSNTSTSETISPNRPSRDSNRPSQTSNHPTRDSHQMSASAPSGRNPSPPTRRPDRPGMNAFTVASNEPPPAYTPLPASPSPASELQGSQPNTPAEAGASSATTSTTRSGEDPFSFLSTFDTTLLIDDSGSMAGRSWREVSQALATIAPIVTAHDNDGIDVYFLNHKSSDPGVLSDGIAPGGYRGIKRAATVTEIFATVRPQGGTPTGIRVHNILKPYLAKLEKDLPEGKEVKPLNLIVLTDGVPSDDVESVLLSAAKKLDKLDAPPFQVGVQFFQVGNEEGAKEALEELDDEICNMVEGGVRDIVDTVTWTGGASASEGGVGLTGNHILKACMGSVNRRLDRMKSH